MLEEASFRTARILIVDDQERNIHLLKAILGSEGYANVVGTTEPREVASLFESFQPDLILLDLRMPELSGFEIMQQIKPLIPEGSYLPILVITADISPEAKQQALSMGAKDFLTKPLDFTETLLRIRNLLETRILHARLENQNQVLEEKVHERTLELAAAHKQLEGERTRLARILEQLPVGVLVAEAETTQQPMHWSFINRVGQDQLDMLLPPALSYDAPWAMDHNSLASILRRPSSLAHQPDDQPDDQADMPLRRILWNAHAGPGQEVVFRNRSGEECVFLATSTLLQEEGDTREAVAVLQDITARKQLEQQKDDFITLASHELRTPLTVLKGYTKLALKNANKSGDTRLARVLEIMDGRIDQLTQLATTLLDVSKMQSDTFSIGQSKFDLSWSTRDLISGLELTAPGFKISVDIPTSPVMVDGDRLRIEQVLTNLVSNAIKYSGRSRRAEIHVIPSGDEVITSVRDFGIGIPADKQARIFERFFQAGDISSHKSGMGLGLFISHKIVASHGGRMWFESTEHEGTTFYFSLPLA
jgi:signal transduction histidine kinase/DNA-binding response OmpR family regulator